MKRTFLFHLWLFIGMVGLQAQVTVVPLVSPPYSPFFEDYLRFQNQEVLTLINTSSRQLTLKLVGHIEGDNGFFAYIPSEYQPATPIVLQPLETRTFTPLDPDLNVFDRNAVVTNVPDRQQRSILARGILPEGNYTFCIQAFDYNTGVELSPPSPSGCTVLNISYLQPPAIANPVCQSTIVSPWPTFIWSPPVGNMGAGMIQYDLYLQKLQPGEDPNIAINRAVDYNAGNPIVKRDLMRNNYVYTAADLPLEDGSSYAMQVIARDPNGELQFENRGRSEVCTFTYQHPDSTKGNGGLGVDDDLITSGKIPLTHVSGQLRYHFPGKQKKGSTGFFAEVESLPVSSQPSEYWAINSYDQPLYFDANLKPTKHSEPLADMKVKLVVRYILKGYELLSTPGETITQATFVLPKDNHPFHPEDNGKTLAITQTDANGNYSFHFPLFDSMKVLQDFGGPQGMGVGTTQDPTLSWENGKPVSHSGDYFSQYDFKQLVRVLRLEVESPYYCSPEVNILVQPKQSAQVPTQVSEVRSYRLRVQTFADSTHDAFTNHHKTLKGATVEILRAHNVFHTPPKEIPEDEGMELNESEGSGLVQWEVISRGETDKNGFVTLNHLVRHSIHSPNDQYIIRASTKLANTFDYYQTTSIQYPDGTGRDDQFPYSTHATVYNSQFKPELYDAEITLQTEKPKIIGRVIQVAPKGMIPLENVGVNVSLAPINKGPDAFTDTLMFTDQDGNFEIGDLPIDYDGYLTIMKTGYHTMTVPIEQLRPGMLQDKGEIQLIPMGKVFGYVSNEQGEPIQADVKLAEGPYSPTEWVFLPEERETPNKKNRFDPPTGKVSKSPVASFPGIPKSRFLFGAQSGKNLVLRIEPYSDKYFPMEFIVDVDMAAIDKNFMNEAKYQYLGEFTIPEKLHRVRFVVRDEKGAMVQGARIELQDTALYTKKGIALYAFASPGQFFQVKVVPPAESNLVVWYEEIEIPISPEFETYDITLEQGKSVSGQVTAGPDSMPLPGARVFVKSDLFWINEFPIAEATTDENGRYTLNGLPDDTLYTVAGTAVPSMIRIRAVKADPEVSYIGDEQVISVPIRDKVNLHLDVLDNLNLTHLWGLPIEIETFEPDENGGGILTGAFIKLPANDNFSLEDPSVRLTFFEIPIEPGNQTDTQGIPIARPVEEQIVADQSSLIVKVFENYTGKMNSETYYSYENGAELIKIGHDGAGNGVINGHVGILLSSFNFSYQYKGRLILADTPDDTKIPVFSATNIPRRTYHLVDYKRGYALKDAYYQVHNFNAHADRAKSYINGDSIRLYTVLHTQIPDTDPGDLKIEAGNITIVPDNILPFQSGKKLVFHLDKWKVAAQTPWFYSKNAGAIFISKAIVHTGIVDVPVKNVRLQPDDLDIDEPQIKKGLTLGGVVPLQVYTSNFFFGYDTKCASDQKPHWRLTLINEYDDPVAMFSGLPGAENHEIHLGSFSLFSNGEQIVGDLDEKVRFYDIMDMHLTQIATGVGFFTVGGSVDLGIPHLSKSLSSKFTYTKPPGGTIKGEWEPLVFTLEGTGKVEFEAYQEGQVLLPGIYVSKGKIRIYEEGEEILLEGSLTRNTTGCTVQVIKPDGQPQIIELGSPDNRMVVLQGQMNADLVNDTWDRFSFRARLEGFKGIEKGKDEMTFVVDGAISASDQEISITDIQTPFGGISMIYNFKEQFLFGSMHIQNIGIGPLEISQGDFEIMMDKQGYYFLFGGTVKVPVINEIGMAFLVGNYPEFNGTMRDRFESYSYNKTIPPGFEDGFSGFLFNGHWAYELLNNDGIDLELFSVYATATVGLDLRVSADFGDGAYQLYILGYGNFGLELSAGCATGFFFLNAELGLGAEIVDGNFDLIGCASISAGIGFENCIPVDPLALICLDACIGACWTGSIKADLRWGESSPTPDFDISFGGTCSGQSLDVGNKTNLPCN